MAQLTETTAAKKITAGHYFYKGYQIEKIEESSSWAILEPVTVTTDFETGATIVDWVACDGAESLGSAKWLIDNWT